SFRFESKQFPDRRGYRAPLQLRDGASEAREIFGRDIYAAERKVGADITKNIRELENNPEALRQFQCVWILKAKNMQASEPHRAGHTIAIFLQTLEGRVLCLQEIH